MGFLGRLGRGIKRSFTGMINFFRGVGTELKKVSWPTRQELFKYTLVVLVTVTLMTVFITMLDLGIANLVEMITAA